MGKDKHASHPSTRKPALTSTPHSVSTCSGDGCWVTCTSDVAYRLGKDSSARLKIPESPASERSVGRNPSNRMRYRRRPAEAAEAYLRLGTARNFRVRQPPFTVFCFPYRPSTKSSDKGTETLGRFSGPWHSSP